MKIRDRISPTNVKRAAAFLVALGLAQSFATLCVFASTSANYSLPTMTTDSGGGQSASANYSQRTSVGTYGGIATAAPPGVTVRAGYIGQFFDVTGLAVSATSTNINEGTTQQLLATAQMDDGTSLAASSRASWTVLSGPVASVSGSGLATADAVYQNTAALVRAQYQGFQATLGLTVLNIDPDNFGLYASDGLPDLWQVQYFGTNNPVGAPAADPDGDGQNNLFEYTVGTVPTDPGSSFKLDISAVPGQTKKYAITFSPRLNDRVYAVESRLSFSAGPFQPLTGAITNDAGQVRAVTDTVTFLPIQRYYRVRISKP